MAMDGIFAPRLRPTDETRAVLRRWRQSMHTLVTVSDMQHLEMKHVAAHEQTDVVRARMKIDWR